MMRKESSKHLRVFKKQNRNKKTITNQHQPKKSNVVFENCYKVKPFTAEVPIVPSHGIKSRSRTGKPEADA